MSKTVRYILVFFVCAWVAKEIILPVTAAAIWSFEYMRLTHACDTAMEASWYYRQGERVSKASEITQLLVCHEYDKARKILLMSGLPESYLSWLGLKSLELYQRSPEEYVKQHRFEQR